MLLGAVVTAPGVSLAQSRHQLRVSPGEVTAVAEVARAAARRVTFYATEVCLTWGPRVRVTAVDLVDPIGGGEVTDYAIVRGRDNLPGIANRPLRNVPALRAGTTVLSDRCSRPGHGYWVLYVELRKPAATPVAGGSALRVTYRAGERKRSIRSENGFYICDDVHSNTCTTE